jgi:hypothetical protein
MFMKNRFVLLMPSKTPGALVGAGLATTLTDVKRSGIFQAQANAPGPPPDTPTIAKRGYLVDSINYQV